MQVPEAVDRDSDSQVFLGSAGVIDYVACDFALSWTWGTIGCHPGAETFAHRAAPWALAAGINHNGILWSWGCLTMFQDFVVPNDPSLA